MESCQRSTSKRSWRSIKAKTPLTAAKVRDWEEPKDMKLVKIQVSPFFTRSSSLSTWFHSAAVAVWLRTIIFFYLSWVLKIFWSHSSYFPIGHSSISNNCRSERQISPVFLASTIQAAGSISSARRSSKKLNIPSQSLRRIFHSRIQMEMLTQGLLKSLGRSRRASARSASDGSGRRLAFCGRAARRRGQSVTPRLARFS